MLVEPAATGSVAITRNGRGELAATAPDCADGCPGRVVGEW
jgi:hypothetical protein